MAEIIIKNHPGTTMAAAARNIKKDYLISERFKYQDENGELVDGEHWHEFNTQKFMETELLHKAEIEGLALSGEEVQLPSTEGLCYVGKGIQFEYAGKRYDMDGENREVFLEAVAAGGVRWFWNRDAWRKYGGKSSASFDVYLVDKSGQAIPDCHLTGITKPVL